MTITKKGNRLWLKFPYHKKLLEEIKTSFVAPKWHGYEEPPIKQWSVKDCYHNWFQIDFLQGKDPYKHYKSNNTQIVHWKRNLYTHQKLMALHLLLRKHCLISGEMGVGKTLSVIEAMEISGIEHWLYVAPRSALYAVQMEFEKWDATIWPKFVTYASLKKLVETWEEDAPVFEGIVFDECHKIKTPTAQRSQAAAHLADAIRDEYGFNGYIWLMSGSPAPKSPIDWWHQCEVACPGYLKEGSIHRFKERLGIVAQAENETTGGVYQQLVTWRDDEDKCDICGEFKDHINHDETNMLEDWYHDFKKSKNEVSYLYKRMTGLVDFHFKKDCLDLPEKNYIQIRCEPSQKTLNLAQTIANTAKSTIQALTLLRELSDGFQYKKEKSGETQCTTCKGTGEYQHWHWFGEEGQETQNYDDDPNWELVKQVCPTCGGSGQTDTFSKVAKHVECPKDQAIRDLLDSHDETGRLVIYAGFTGSIDRIIGIIRAIKGWDYIRVDGRGWDSSIGGNPTGLLKCFQEGLETYSRIVFVGAPGAAGTGLTLTASPSIVYYSNDFNAESRIQSEDRIHRPGCRGANIYDIIHLPTDEYVLENLRAKRKLQSLSQGEVQQCLMV